MSMTSESDEWMNSKNDTDSPSVDDISSGGNMGANGPLKKGPWTSAEDAILVEYVTKHGEGNWNAVQKHSGLARCGKSCRLRWANHLRPDLKKGAFSPEEERHIIELHAKMGNKWARMAAELPGRTDNEIKNYWNTRIKRRQRAGLPIYPPDICFQASNENEQNEEMAAFSSGDAHHPDYLSMNHFEFPHVEFKTMELDQLLYPTAFLDLPPESLLDVPANSFLSQVKDEAADDLVLMKHDNMTEVRNQMVFSTPDFLLASDFFAHKKDQSNNHSLLKDALCTLLCDDLSKDCKQLDMPDSCSWNAMPTV